MTLAEFRDYIAAPERDGNPAILAARAFVAEYDRQAAFLKDRAAKQPLAGVLEQQVRELAADVGSYRRELARLRDELARHNRAPWEGETDD